MGKNFGQVPRGRPSGWQCSELIDTLPIDMQKCFDTRKESLGTGREAISPRLTKNVFSVSCSLP